MDSLGGEGGLRAGVGVEVEASLGGGGEGGGGGGLLPHLTVEHSSSTLFVYTMSIPLLLYSRILKTVSEGRTVKEVSSFFRTM